MIHKLRLSKESKVCKPIIWVDRLEALNRRGELGDLGRGVGAPQYLGMSQYMAVRVFPLSARDSRCGTVGAQSGPTQTGQSNRFDQFARVNQRIWRMLAREGPRQG